MPNKPFNRANIRSDGLFCVVSPKFRRRNIPSNVSYIPSNISFSIAFFYLTNQCLHQNKTKQDKTEQKPTQSNNNGNKRLYAQRTTINGKTINGTINKNKCTQKCEKKPTSLHFGRAPPFNSVRLFVWKKKINM